MRRCMPGASVKQETFPHSSAAAVEAGIKSLKTYDFYVKQRGRALCRS